MEELRQPLAADTMAALSLATTPSANDVQDAAKIIMSDSREHPHLLCLSAIRCRSGLAIGDAHGAAAWLSVWMQLAPDTAWSEVRRFRDLLWHGDDHLMEGLFRELGQYAVLGNMPPQVMADLAIDLQRHVRVADDDERSGDVTGRHHAQDMRSAVPTVLSQHTSAEAREALLRLLNEPEFANYRDWLHRLLLKQAAAAAAPKAWTELHVTQFFGAWMKRPTTVEELGALIERQLVSIASALRTSEFDIRALFAHASEADLRAFLGEALLARSQGWYGVTQEAVTAGENRTDLRIEGRSHTGEIVIVELKVAGESWTGDALVDHLETQLVQQYLISRRVRHGLYVVVDLQRRASWPMAVGGALTFKGLIERLEAEAARLVDIYPSVDDIRVVPLRITLPTSARAAARGRGRVHRRSDLPDASVCDQT
jgi:hypothetical protein